MIDPKLLKALARNNKRYVCVGCQTEVNNVGAYMSMDPPCPPPFPAAARVCKSCSDRITRCEIFFAEVSERVPNALRDEFLTAVASTLGLTLSEWQKGSVNAYAAYDEPLPQYACEALDMAIGVKLGTHMMAREQTNGQ